jgi:Sec-independent protein translocase protein TatA
MENSNSTGIIILIGIVGIVLFGGFKNTSNIAHINTATTTTTKSTTPKQNEVSVEQKTSEIQNQLENIKKQVQIKEDEKTQSRYKGIVTLSYINESTNSSQEYATIRVSGNATSTIQVTGWILKSLSTGNQVTIPKGTYLFFTGMINTEDNILLTGGDTLYLVTGTSPVGASFKVNKCSGYLGQFQTFVPYLSNSCPAPRNEDLSSIPKLVINDACLDYINSMSQCRIQMKSLPVNWSSECVNFIYDKINYPSCVNTHKSDNDFYKKEWRVYLKRSESLWKDRRETIVLYDNVGKIVDTLNY